MGNGRGEAVAAGIEPAKRLVCSMFSSRNAAISVKKQKNSYTTGEEKKDCKKNTKQASAIVQRRRAQRQTAVEPNGMAGA